MERVLSSARGERLGKEDGMRTQTVRNAEVPEAIGFDPYADAYAADPHPTWRALRERAPMVAWREGRALLVVRYEPAAQLLSDVRFSLRLADWEHAPPPPKPGEESEFDLLM